MDIFFQIVGMVGSISAVTIGLISLIYRLVEDHGDLVKLREEVERLNKQVYNDFWALSGRIAALQDLEEGKNDGEIKTKG